MKLDEDVLYLLGYLTENQWKDAIKYKKYFKEYKEEVEKHYK